MRATYISSLLFITASILAVPEAASAGSTDCSAATAAWAQKRSPAPKQSFRDGRKYQVGHRGPFKAKSGACLVVEEVLVTRVDGSAALVGRNLFALADGKSVKKGHAIVRGNALAACEVQGQRCASIQQWDRLATLLMSK